MSRSKIDELNRQFAELHDARCALTRDSDVSELFRPAGHGEALWPASPAVSLVRSAAAVEQMINGITVRLWDDPFEWTLPERLRTAADMIAYFDEVEAARIRGFHFFKDDADLERSIPAPAELKKLGEVLKDAFARSEGYFSEAKAMFGDT